MDGEVFDTRATEPVSNTVKVYYNNNVIFETEGELTVTQVRDAAIGAGIRKFTVESRDDHTPLYSDDFPTDEDVQINAYNAPKSE